MDKPVGGVAVFYIQSVAAWWCHRLLHQQICCDGMTKENYGDIQRKRNMILALCEEEEEEEARAGRRGGGRGGGGEAEPVIVAASERWQQTVS